MDSSGAAYEAQREARIAENKRRMFEMGLLTASQELNAAAAQRRPAKKLRRMPTPRAPVDPSHLRRSGRSEGKVAPVYNENALDEVYPRGRSRGKGSKRILVFDDRLVGHQQESYTKAQLDMLGSYDTPWELFVDGYDTATGKRMYDRAEGRTCHQCRQKTLGKRTECSQCHSLTGVFCGDCLFMRYGENVDEVNARGSWTCPHCRDPTLCNCSQHRTRLGWGPTGTLYRRAIAEGFKSVAHYLVLNHLEGSPSSDISSDTAVELDAAQFGAAESEATRASPPGAKPGNDDCTGTSEVRGRAKATRAGANSAGVAWAACTKMLTNLTPHQRRIDQTLAQRKCVAAAVKDGRTSTVVTRSARPPKLLRVSTWAPLRPRRAAAAS